NHSSKRDGKLQWGSMFKGHHHLIQFSSRSGDGLIGDGVSNVQAAASCCNGARGYQFSKHSKVEE
ncbi:hypothetical protein ACLOJK_004496, partial [Asimina triloba]